MGKKAPFASVSQGKAAREQVALSKVHADRISVPARIISEPGPGGSTLGARFGLDFRDVPPPVRLYAADVAWAHGDHRDTKIVFAQLSLDGIRLDTALQLRLSPIALLQFLDSIAGMPSPSLEEIAETMMIEPEPLGNLTNEPTDIARAVANVILISISGFETCLDVYHTPARAILAMQQGANQSRVGVDPVVRVDLRTSLFLSLLSKLRELSYGYPADFVERMRNGRI